MTFHLHPSLYTGRSVLHVYIGLLLGSGSLLLSTSYPYARRAFTSYHVVLLIGVSRESDSTSTPPLILLFTIFQHIFINIFSYDSNSLLNAVQLMVSEVLEFHENTELFPSGDSYEISPGNNYSTERNMFVILGFLSEISMDGCR